MNLVKRQSRRAFTLLELVVVMLLLTIMMAMAAPSLRNFWKGNRVKDAGDQLVYITRLARSQAITNGTLYRLGIDPDGLGYFLTVQQADGFALAPGQNYRLPEETRIDLTKADGSIADHIDFYPNGRTEPATIRVSSAGHNDIVITCFSPTELFSLVNADGSIQ
jgi:prepilin-type N-terminal cleavage/methylation domain-containing protein